MELHIGDCLEVMREMDDNLVDAVVTDPPYNVGLNYSGGDNRNDYQEWCSSWFSMLQRVCNGAIAISVGQANLSQWAAIAPPTWWLAWWKPAAMGRCVAGFNNWEPIALYGKPKNTFCDVIRATIKPDPSLAGHPCPKPLEWAVKQIEMLSQPNDVVLDPFMGSGTTGVACVKTGRRFIGIEIDEGYAEIARNRIANEETKMPLLQLMDIE